MPRGQPIEGLQLLLVVMCGAIYTLLVTKPPLAVAPSLFAYGINFCLSARKASEPTVLAGALALGAAGGMVMHRMGKKKAEGKRSAGTKKAK